MNNIFTSIYSTVNSIFTQKEYLYKDIYPEDISKSLYNFIDINEILINMRITNPYVNLYVFKSEIQKDMINTTILVDNKPTLIFIIPYNFNYEDFDEEQKIKIIKKIYDNIIDCVSKDFYSELKKLSNIAKDILPIKTLIEVVQYLEFDSLCEFYRYVNNHISLYSEEQLEKIHEISIEDLFDYGYILKI